MASLLKQLLTRTGYMFYIVDRNSTTFETEEEVPEYVNEAIPIFLSFLALEFIISALKGKKKIGRISDILSSMGHGTLMETSKVLVNTFELTGYVWLYQRRFFNPDWSSAVTWWAAAIGSDFCYYWFHRATHEVNLIWSSHQVHHSAEDYNYSTALRQSIFQRFFSFGFYQPLALLGVPLPAILVHYQFNLLFQFWIHTEMIKNCGPVEWIFNTPSHHRVHHGANKWCLDKNYAGVLIIWDRMFGTFEAERDDDEIVFGLVGQPQTYNAFYHQLFYFQAVFEKAHKMSTWSDKLKALFYGPGWAPGDPRLGDPDKFPDVKAPRKKYDPKIPFWTEIYFLVHFFAMLLVQQALLQQQSVRPRSEFPAKKMSWSSCLTYIAFIIVSISIIGAVYDGWWLAPLVEAARCVSFVVYICGNTVTPWPAVDAVLLPYFAVSALIWVRQCFTVLRADKSVKAE